MMGAEGQTIQMLSRFRLAPGAGIRAFCESYEKLVELMARRGLVLATGPVGKRVADTPMDTDSGDAEELFAVMTFRDRQQLDAAYAYLNQPGHIPEPELRAAHEQLKSSVAMPVFTCWQDLE